MEYMTKEIKSYGITITDLNERTYRNMEICKLEEDGWICKKHRTWISGDIYCRTSYFIKPKLKNKRKEDDMSKKSSKNIGNEWAKEIMNIAKLAYDAQETYKNEYLREIIGSCKAITISLDCCKDSDS